MAAEQNIGTDIEAVYGKRPRIRVCGFIQDDKHRFLLLKHEGVGELGHIWAPPGGGLEFGEAMEDCLLREIKEETKLEVEIGSFLFANEFLSPRLHAVELFFQVAKWKGSPALGVDPEMEGRKAVLTALRWFTLKEIQAEDPRYFHNSFRHMNSAANLDNMPAYITFQV